MPVMVTALRRRMGVLGVVMTFLAILFALAPISEAAACAADGCATICIEEAAEAGAAGHEDSDCPEQHCIWAAGHNHPAAASLPAQVEASVAYISERVPMTGNQRLVSASPKTLERPPRA